jgi:hypothetical protein
MTAITTPLRVLFSLIAMAGFLWLIAAAADHSWPEAKWYFVALFVGLWLFVFSRHFIGQVGEYRDAIDAFVYRRIVTADLPPDFRSLSHDRTLQQIIDEFGPPSRKTKLAAPPASGGSSPAHRSVKFLAYEYDLPYEAAVIIMPEPPCKPDSKVRAVYFRPRPNDDEFLSPVRA